MRGPKFIIRTSPDEEYATVYIDILNDNEVAVEVERRNTPVEEWTSSRLVRAYKKAYKNHDTRNMGKYRSILQHKYGEDIYVKNDKIYLLTYNGCERRV